MLLHGSTVATNAVLEHKFDGLGLLVTKGFRHLIEIARQSVPDGYGNSFFWVKPLGPADRDRRRHERHGIDEDREGSAENLHEAAARRKPRHLRGRRRRRDAGVASDDAILPDEDGKVCRVG